VAVATALAGGGALLGVLGALWFARLLSVLLFGVSAHDPATFATVVGFLIGLAALTAYVPARAVVRRGALLAIRS